MSRPWFRMYAEFASDPKVQLLAFDDQRHFIMLLCLKCNGTIDSKATPDFMDRMVSKALGLDILSATEAKRRLCEVGLITDRWQPIKWDDRQYQHDLSTDRVRKFRERNASETLQKQNETVSGTDESRAEQKQSRAKESPATRLPEDFSLTEERRKAADAEGLDPIRTLEKFRDYWRAMPGTRGRKVDWDATWRNWCRNERRPATDKKQPSNPYANAI